MSSKLGTRILGSLLTGFKPTCAATVALAERCEPAHRHAPAVGAPHGDIAQLHRRERRLAL